MSITDELREWFEHAYSYGTGERMFEKIPRPWFGWKLDLEQMLDRIDAEHERKVAEAASDWEYWESTHVELPKDADGEHIRVGERVQLIGNDPSTVSHMMLADDGWRVYVKYDGGIGTGSGEPKSIRHHHATTVEDVLTEMFAKAIERGELTNGAAQTIAEYASKLQLKEDA